MLKELQQRFSLTYLFVTHHLLVVKYISDHGAEPQLNLIDDNHQVACLRHQEVPELAAKKYGAAYLHSG